MEVNGFMVTQTLKLYYSHPLAALADWHDELEIQAGRLPSGVRLRQDPSAAALFLAARAHQVCLPFHHLERANFFP